MMLSRGLVVVAFAMFFVSLVIQSVPAAIGGVAIAFLAFISAYAEKGDKQ